MGLWSLISGRRRRDPAATARVRAPFFEKMEARRNMAADPVKVGMVYIEEDSGSDLHGDRFELQFEGGAPGTELKRLVLDTDKGAAGLGVGDLFFDTLKAGLGADEAFPLQILSQDGITDVKWTVSDGGTQLILDFSGFHAGHKLVFSIDVDEVQDFDPTETDPAIVNEGIDPITSGVEFQGSQLTATFDATNYFDATNTGEFRNLYDPLFTGSNLLANASNPDGLPADNFNGKRDRSTGVLVVAQQQPRPAELSGYVYVDTDNDGLRDAGERGIGGVTVRVIAIDTIQPQNDILLTTDANGFYHATNLMPGKYRVVEVQPSGYSDGLDAAGTVSGQVRGRAVNPGDNLEDINLVGGDAGIEYNFGELEPASIRGRVHLTDRFGSCTGDGVTPLPPVVDAEVRLFDANGVLLATRFTDENGEYEFTNLVPGKYTIVEITPEGLKDGGDHVGTVDGVKRGSLGDNDVLKDIVLGSGDDGFDYDFCEHLPSNLSGHVYHDQDNDGRRDADEDAIAGVRLALIDANGATLATTTTDAAGYYRFSGLSAGVYRVVEQQPSGWSDGLDTPGTVLGQTVGRATNPGDQLDGIQLYWGDAGVDYDFGELQVASIAGQVFVDVQRDNIHQADEPLLAGVTIQLYNEQGVLVATTTTDAQGQYKFTGLNPGRYEVRELQPAGYFQGGQKAGTKGGNDSQADIISTVDLASGDDALHYDFCEVQRAALSGEVWVDTIGNQVRDASETPLAGVTLQLFNAQDELVATTQTDANGRYRFDNLQPGTYNVRELQPAGYFQGGQVAGSTGGDDSLADRISGIELVGGESTQNNFCEIPPSIISGYVFRDGPVLTTANGQAPDNIDDLRDGKLTADDLRLSGVTLRLYYTGTADPVLGEETLPGTNAAGYLEVVTDANGYYEFRGLRNDNYSIVQVQPAGYTDGKDTPGSLGGLALNPRDIVNPFLLEPFAVAGVNLNHDALLRIAVGVGQHAQLNNFSEVQFTSIVLPPIYPDPPAQFPPPQPFIRPAFVEVLPLQFFPTPQTEELITGGSGPGYTWHLSVVNEGQARATNYSTWLDGTPWKNASLAERAKWQAEYLADGQWSLPTETAGLRKHPLFGRAEGTPIVGDFNGDGLAEIGIFVNGEWFIDLNGDGSWDDGDLYARLGTQGDRPVVGDWDGDGKDDIGIFGPEWQNDPRHIEHEPGLPDTANTLGHTDVKRPKNVPPLPLEATDGRRVLQQTEHAPERADLIDHVFRFGVQTDVPVAGDWNGDGIASIGVFREGKWHFDEDGDGKWSPGDETAEFGRDGDRPVVGDFNGDGRDEIGVYREGTWIIDANGNRELDEGDKRFDLGTPHDLPAVGDFNGDGVDEAATYTPGISGSAETSAEPTE